MNSIPRLVAENRRILEQGRDLLRRMDDEVFRGDHSGLRTGRHLRHILDHYRSLLSGRDVIDYDARMRDTEEEVNRDAALQAIGEILVALGRLDGDRPLRVRNNDDPAEPVPLLAASSLSRELQFVLSHTVHHFALLAIALRARGLEPPADFGVAPSTLYYEASRSGTSDRQA